MEETSPLSSNDISKKLICTVDELQNNIYTLLEDITSIGKTDIILNNKNNEEISASILLKVNSTNVMIDNLIGILKWEIVIFF